MIDMSLETTIAIIIPFLVGLLPWVIVKMLDWYDNFREIREIRKISVDEWVGIDGNIDVRDGTVDIWLFTLGTLDRSPTTCDGSILLEMENLGHGRRAISRAISIEELPNLSEAIRIKNL